MATQLRRPPGDPVAGGPRARRPRPADPTLLHEVALLPLRAFLGVTLTFAGLQKLASTSYLDPHARAGVAAQMRAASHSSPIGGLLTSVGHHAVLFGLLIALGELAVGIGTLLGLWTRAAAVGGMALSLSFLLAVSWHSSPYYLGPDIVFLAAFTPLAIAPPGRWTVDATIRRRLRLGGPPGVPVADERRRQFLETLTVAGWVGLVGLAGAGAAASFGRLLGAHPSGSAAGPISLRPPTTSAGGGSPITSTGSGTSAGTGVNGDPGTGATTPTAPTTSTAPPTTTPPGTPIGLASDVPVGGSAMFRDPATGSPSVVVQPRAGVFEACSAVCTHQGCTVGYNGSTLHCPCHGAEFDPATGAVLQGPAQQPLATLAIRSSSGTLYVGT